MADPITLGIIAASVAAAASTAMTAASASSAASAQSKAFRYQAEADKQAGVQATNTAAANMAVQQRQSAGQLGEQAASLGEANVGTGGSAGQVEKQSATNARMDQLNTWYGGELERHQMFQEADLNRYNSLIERNNSDSALIGGSIGAGTKLLMAGGAAYSPGFAQGMRIGNGVF